MRNNVSVSMDNASTRRWWKLSGTCDDKARIYTRQANKRREIAKQENNERNIWTLDSRPIHACSRVAVWVSPAGGTAKEHIRRMEHFGSPRGYRRQSWHDIRMMLMRRMTIMTTNEYFCLLLRKLLGLMYAERRLYLPVLVMSTVKHHWLQLHIGCGLISAAHCNIQDLRRRWPPRYTAFPVWCPTAPTSLWS